METKLKIKVTKEILERSKMCGCGVDKIGTSCAISLAIIDIFPKAYVGRYGINFSGRIIYDHVDEDILLPKEARDFVADFDAASPFLRPNLPEFEFEITIPDEVIAQINIEEIRPLLVNHPTLQLI